MVKVNIIEIKSFLEISRSTVMMLLLLLISLAGRLYCRSYLGSNHVATDENCNCEMRMSMSHGNTWHTTSLQVTFVGFHILTSS